MASVVFIPATLRLTGSGVNAFGANVDTRGRGQLRHLHSALGFHPAHYPAPLTPRHISFASSPHRRHPFGEPPMELPHETSVHFFLNHVRH
jgi:hypothetical protein